MRRRYLSVLIAFYLAFAVASSVVQVYDTPKGQATAVSIPGSDFELEVQTPKKLTFEGGRRQGRIGMVIRPRSGGAARLNRSATAQEWSFLVRASKGAHLITSDGISYTPIITLSATSNITEASFLIEHAALPGTPADVNIELEDLRTHQLYPRVATIALESRFDLFLRKLLESALALGSIVALIVVGIDYLNEDQKARAEQLKQTVDALRTAQTVDIPLLLRRWVELVSRRRDSPAELHAQLKTVQEAIQRLARSDVAALLAADADWMDNVFATAQRLKTSRVPETIGVLDDLHLVVNTNRSFEGIPSEGVGHTFMDAHLLGVYLNLAWARLGNQVRESMLGNLDTLARQGPDDQSIVLQQALWGIYACDPFVAERNRPSLRDELGHWYSILDVREGEQSGPSIPAPGDPLFSEIIARIAGVSEEGANADLTEWCRNLQDERSRMESRLTEKLRIRSSLWPIQMTGEGKEMKDANYDYSPPPVGLDYWNKAFETLNFPCHHYIQGERGSGKSWLRIHFEDAIWEGHSTFLPVFYFPPLELPYEAEDRVFIYTSIARSVANCLVSALLESYIVEDQEIHEIAPFLARYGYTVPLGASSLVALTPPEADVDSFYANRSQSYRLARIREAMRQARGNLPQNDETGASRILRHISAAVDAAKFDRVYVLIDNLPLNQEQRIWSALQSSEIADGLHYHKVYLKMFGVSTEPTKRWHAQSTIYNPHTKAALAICQQPVQPG